MTIVYHITPMLKSTTLYCDRSVCREIFVNVQATRIKLCILCACYRIVTHELDMLLYVVSTLRYTQSLTHSIAS